MFEGDLIVSGCMRRLDDLRFSLLRVTRSCTGSGGDPLVRPTRVLETLLRGDTKLVGFVRSALSSSCCCLIS